MAGTAGAGPAPVVVVLMGVSGCGKTTTGQALARRLGWIFRDADSFHPAVNIAKMSAGTPLDDADRWPWLRAIAAWSAERLAAGEPAVVTCSALKRAYRDVLVGGRKDVRIVHLSGSPALIGGRLAARRDHFMPPGLLDSQFAALEVPSPDENCLTVDMALPPHDVVDRIVAWLAAPRP